MSLFGKKVEQKSVVSTAFHDEIVDSYEKKVRSLEQDHEFEVKELEQNHKLELKQKEYELKHFKDDEITKLREEVTKVTGELAVAKKENEMLDKLVNVNADIVDVKDLIGKLISKLPEINLKELTIHNGKSQ